MKKTIGHLGSNGNGGALRRLCSFGAFRHDRRLQQPGGLLEANLQPLSRRSAQRNARDRAGDGQTDTECKNQRDGQDY